MSPGQNVLSGEEPLANTQSYEGLFMCDCGPVKCRPKSFIVTLQNVEKFEGYKYFFEVLYFQSTQIRTLWLLTQR